jgi:hypothetical protein
MSSFIPPYIPAVPTTATSGAETPPDQSVQEQEKPHGHKGHGGHGKPHAAKTGIQHGGGQHLRQQLVAQIKSGAGQPPAPRQAAKTGEESKVLLDGDGGGGAANAGGELQLHAAIRAQNRELFEQLLGKGADINAVDGNGHTPLDLALMMFENMREQARDWHAVRLAGFFVTALDAKGALVADRARLNAAQGWLAANGAGDWR